MPCLYVRFGAYTGLDGPFVCIRRQGFDRVDDVVTAVGPSTSSRWKILFLGYRSRFRSLLLIAVESRAANGSVIRVLGLGFECNRITQLVGCAQGLNDVEIENDQDASPRS